MVEVRLALLGGTVVGVDVSVGGGVEVAVEDDDVVVVVVLVKGGTNIGGIDWFIPRLKPTNKTTDYYSQNTDNDTVEHGRLIY